MNCPQCGNEMIKFKHVLGFDKFVCVNDDDALNTILSLFKVPTSGNYLYYGLVIIYSLSDSKFRLTGSNMPISLKTAAMILSDFKEELQ